MAPSTAVTVPHAGAQSSAPGNRRRLQLDAVAFVVAAIVIAWAITPTSPPLDDAYIVVHSGDAVRLGADAAYGVPALTGITSPAFLALVVVGQTVAGSLGGLRLAVVLGLVVFIIGTWALARAVDVDPSRRWIVIAAPLTAGPIGINLVNGLETGWACALIVWSLVGVLDRRPLITSIACGVLPSVRPDLLPVALTFLALTIWHEGRRGLWAIPLALFAALPFVWWVRADTGAWLPATMAAKRWFFAEGCLDGAAKIATTARALATWFFVTAPLAAGVIVASRDRLGRILLAAGAIVVAVYGWSLPGALFHNEFRYVIPMLAPVGLYGFARLAARKTRIATIAALVLIVLGCIPAPGYVLGRRADAEELKDIAAWASARLPSGSRVLVHDAGVISTVDRIRPIDLVGLKTPSSIDAHRRLTWPSCGVERGRAVSDIARAAQPDYFIVLNRWNDIFQFTSDLGKNGWELTTIKPWSGKSERSYAVYRLTLRRANPGANR